MRHFILLSVFCILISACGKKNSSDNPLEGGNTPPPTTPATPGAPSTPTVQGLTYDTSVSESDKALIEQDFNTINSLNITSTDYKYILGINDFSATTLKKWLLDRTKYIVGKNYSRPALAQVVETRDYKPSSIAASLDAETTIVTLMKNVGAEAYLDGKGKSKVFSLPINGIPIVVKSPRVGIIQLGEGHFSVNRVPGTDLSSLANRLLRLAVLFHESRHTDGNGANAAFPHLKCTSGDYAGSYACEANTNGPYMVEWVLLKHFKTQCTTCSSTELGVLQTKITDKLNRLVEGYKMSDATPEGIQ